MKKLVSCLLVCTMLLSFLPVMAAAEGETVITTLAQFDAIRENLTGSYKLGANITLPADYLPIENFAGTLDGANYTVTLNMNKTTAALSSLTKFGLFGSVSAGATISNLTIAGSVSGTQYVAGLVAYVNAAAPTTAITISNIINRAAITCDATYKGVGGIVGYVHAGSSSTHTKAEIKNCVNHGAVSMDTASGNFAAGILGQTISKNTLVSKCYNYGTITGYRRLGGIVGNLGGGIESKVELSGNYGTINAKERTGGIVGYVQYGTIDKCFNAGEVNGQYVAGIVYDGSAYDCVVSNCFNAGALNGTASSSGISTGLGAKSSLINCYNVGTLAGTSKIDITNSPNITTSSNCYYLAGSGSNKTSTIGAVDDLEDLPTGFESTVWEMTPNSVYPYPQLIGNNYIMALEGEDTVNYAGGNGTAQYPYLISNATHFANISLNPDKAFKQTDDITVSAMMSTTFEGTYDGDNNTIMLALSNEDASVVGFGLFKGSTTATVIKNLILDGMISSKGTYTGALIGSSAGGTISNVVNKASVTGEGDRTGGLIGSNASYKITMTNCRNEGAVTGNGRYTGGIAGIGYHVTGTNLANTGTITGGYCTGGIVGAEHATLTQCYNAGTVIGGNQVAGINAQARANITDCYNIGRIKGIGSVSGVAYVAHANAAITISNCLNAGEVIGTTGGAQGVGMTDNNTATTVTNCYYLDPTANGNAAVKGQTAVTREELKTKISALGGAWEANANGYPQLTANKPATALNIALLTVAEAVNGTVTPGTRYIPVGAYTSETFQANDGYRLASATLGSTSISDGVDFQVSGDATLTAVFGDTANFSGGNGTAQHPYEISSAAHFANISKYPEASYKQTGDFTIHTVMETEFKGTYDGQNHTITLDIHATAQYGGLFAKVNGATIQNLRIGGELVCDSTHNGALAGNVTKGTIINVINNATVSGKNYTGGLIGAVGTATIDQCANLGNITGNYGVGGIYATGGGIVINTYNAGTVIGGNNVGGISGQARANITNCYNTGRIIGGTGVSGVGYIAHSNTLTFANCWNAGEIIGTADVGLVGESANETLTLSTCYYLDPSAKANQAVNGVTAVTREELKTKIAALGTAWEADANGYPQLKENKQKAALDIALVTVASVKNGTVTPGTRYIPVGAYTTATFTPNDGYRFEYASLGSVPLFEGTDFLVPGDVTLEAVFVEASKLPPSVTAVKNPFVVNGVEGITFANLTSGYGYDVVEYGVIYSTDIKEISADVPTSCKKLPFVTNSNVSMNQKGQFGIYTQGETLPSSGYYTRAYVTYQLGEGVTKTVYSTNYVTVARQITLTTATDTAAAFGKSYLPEENLGSMLQAAQLQNCVVDNYNGVNYLYTTSAGNPAVFHVINLDTKKVELTQQVTGGTKVWRHALDSKGCVYILANSKLHCYDPATKAVTDLGRYHTVEKDAFTLCVDDDDNVYIGTSNNAKVIKYDPVQKTFTDMGTMLEGMKYVRTISYHDGWLYCGVYATNPGKMVRMELANPSNKEVYEAPSSDLYTPEDIGFFYDSNPVDDFVVFYVQTPGTYRMLVFDTVKGEWVNNGYTGAFQGYYTTQPNDGKAYFMSLGSWQCLDTTTGMITDTGWKPGIKVPIYGGDWVELKNRSDMPGKTYVTINVDTPSDIVLVNFESQTVEVWEDIAMEGSDLSILLMGDMPDGGIYVAAGDAPVDYWFNPQTGEEGNFLAGQIEGCVPYNGKLYLGAYTGARILEYDPNQPYQADVNPKLVGQVTGQDRPFAMTAGDGKIYGGTICKYGGLPGSIFIYDTKTGEFYEENNVVHNQGIMSVAYKDGLLYGSTTIHGGLGSTPTETAAKIFVYDVAKRTKIKEFVPNIPGLDDPIPTDIGELKFGPDGKLWGATGYTIFSIDVDSEIVSDVMTFGTWQNYGTETHKWKPTYIEFDDNGNIYSSMNGIRVINPETGEHKQLTSFGASNYTIGGDGNLYYAKGTEIHMIPIQDK